MGNRNSNSHLTKDEIENYKELTYLTKSEIKRLFDRFKEIDPLVLNENRYARIPFRIISRIPELQNNPFADRIGYVFCSEKDGRWSFEDFLDMASVYHKAAPVATKIQHAFCIFDFDDDGFLSENDIAEMVARLVEDNQLTQEEMRAVLDMIFQEADMDKDGKLSPSEFQHLLMKCFFNKNVRKYLKETRITFTDENYGC